jgi:invasion protein IalB
MTVVKTVPSLSLAALLALSLPLAAQEAATEGADETTAEAPAATEEAAPEASEAPAAPSGDLATGAPAAPQGPRIYVREEHGDWEVRCLEAPEGQEDPCQLFQRLEDQGGQPTADINFFDVPDGEEIVAGATLLTPLQTLLTAQVTMSIDGGEPKRYPYSFCDQSGCYSRMGFTEGDVAALRRGAVATVIVVPALAPDQPAQLEMSLSGFTAGLAAVTVDG